MKLLAVFAPSQDVRDRFFSTMPTSLAWALAPLIAEVDRGNLPEVEYAPKIFDPLRIQPTIWEEYQILLESERPDVLLISSTYDSHFTAIHLATMTRRFNPEVLVIYGGPHVDEVANRKVISVMPQTYPFNETGCPFDILVKGDGELVLLYLIRELGNKKGRQVLLEYLNTSEARMAFTCIPGTFEVHARMMNGEVQVITGTGLPLNLSQLPFMPRKLFGHDLDLYGFSCFREQRANSTFKLLPSTSTMLHRGCRSLCIFCSERGGYLARSLDHIAAELDELVKAGIKGVFFDDSTFGDHEGFDELLACLRSFPLQYGSLNRFDALQDASFVEKLAKGGFVYQYCAIEQFSDSVLKASAKGQRIEEIRRGIENLRASGMQLGTSLLFGFPAETEASVNATLDFVAEVEKLGILSCVSMSLYSYHPNTPLTLGTREGEQMHSLLHYDREPPNQGEPWNCFEEGQWFHPSWLAAERVNYIHHQAQQRIGSKLVRNMRKDGDAFRGVK
ncbi:MAG: Radical SAM domain protein [Parcubacteria group bacterium GW2011_GWA2_43_9b]|uniref:Radical SAM core domain-containing protein n=1 Tax=Candidatus Portnoybacteria bacterium RIFCSPLOWO2_02_FULL_39_11 TaxID=1802001 RepID=A0A1G2FST6_9BACT|nr:MAG: Radical SAM domain protein [Parcubacteria group bacterium GW2011_GWA2_43_9b]OGZ40710.1 MAG: hypothetical protein A3B04_00850 [Candidatus Portnoybacteria bacterium RIFCSPLOWO2_02_FULL_39_11]